MDDAKETLSMFKRSRGSRGTPRTWLVLVTVGMAIVSFACETTVGGVRAGGFPPDLGYIPKARLKTAMWVLAAEIKELERELSRPVDVDEAPRRTATIAILERMQVAVSTLEDPGRSSQHPVLNQNLDVFLSRLDRAQRALERDPPDFFPASTIAGSCYLCHGQTKAMASIH